MAIKTNKPVTRTAQTFDNIDIVDIRFRMIAGEWKCTIKYKLLSDSGETDNKIYTDKDTVTENEIKKMYNLIAKITDGKII